MNTLTYEQIRYAFNRLQMIGDRDLPMRVSYAMTRTKNKYLKPEIQTFQEETEGVEANTEEFEKHLQKQVEVEAHNVSAQELEGEGIQPQTFVGLSFLFSEHDQLDRRCCEEFKNRTLIPIINTFYRWSEMEFNSPEAILAVSAAIDEMRSDMADVDERLTDVNRRIRQAKNPQSDEDIDEELVETLKEEREEILDETTKITIVEFDLETIVDAEDDLKVSPNQIEVLDPFLK